MLYRVLVCQCLLKCHYSLLSMIRYHAAAGHVLLKFHHSVLDSGCTGTVTSFFVNFWPVQDKPSFRGRYSTRPINTSNKTCGESIMLAVFFCPIYVYFLSTTLSSSLPLVTHNRVVTWQAFLLNFLPPYRACLRANREKLYVTCL